MGKIREGAGRGPGLPSPIPGLCTTACVCEHLDLKRTPAAHSCSTRTHTHEPWAPRSPPPYPPHLSPAPTLEPYQNIPNVLFEEQFFLNKKWQSCCLSVSLLASRENEIINPLEDTESRTPGSFLINCLSITVWEYSQWRTVNKMIERLIHFINIALNLFMYLNHKINYDCDVMEKKVV